MLSWIQKGYRNSDRGFWQIKQEIGYKKRQCGSIRNLNGVIFLEKVGIKDHSKDDKRWSPVLHWKNNQRINHRQIMASKNAAYEKQMIVIHQQEAWIDNNFHTGLFQRFFLFYWGGVRIQAPGAYIRLPQLRNRGLPKSFGGPKLTLHWHPRIEKKELRKKYARTTQELRNRG